MAGDYTAEMVGASPTKHASQHMSGGNDSITPEDIGAATIGHDHNETYSLIGHNHNDMYATKQHTHKLAEIEGLDQGDSGDLQAIADLQEDVKNLQEAMGNHTHTIDELGAASAEHTHTASEVGAAVEGHTHTATDVTGLSKIATSGAYSDLSGIPNEFLPSIHASAHAAGGADAITPASIGALDQATADGLYASKLYVDEAIAAAIANIPVYDGTVS